MPVPASQLSSNKHFVHTGAVAERLGNQIGEPGAHIIGIKNRILGCLTHAIDAV